MNKPLTSYQIFLMCIAGLLLLLFNIDSIRSSSVDLAHNYALTYRIAETFSAAYSNDPSLGEMNFYPRMSHIFAAIIGHFLNSPLLGVQIVALIAFIALWGAVICILFTLPFRVASSSSIALVCALGANRLLFHFQVHGVEINGNFFFAQIVAQSMLFIALAVVIFLEIKGFSNFSIALFMMFAVFFITEVHLLPAVELLGVFCGNVLIENYLLLNKPLDRRIKIHLWSLAAVIAAVISVIFNPTFEAMRKISENNGALSVNHFNSNVKLILLCVIASAIATFLLGFWKRHHTDNKEGFTAVKYLGLYGGSVALLFLIQIVALKLGYGSEYAVKKYAFGLITNIFISISVLTGFFFNKYHSGNLFDRLRENSLFRTFVALLTFVGAFILCISPHKSNNTLDVVALERQLINISDTILPRADNKSNVVMGLKDMQPTINYMFSIAIAKTPRSLAISDVLSGNGLSDAEDYNVILTSKNSQPYDSDKCRIVPYSGELALINAACYLMTLNPSLDIFDFTSSGWIDPAMISGFSIPEDHGRWTVDKKSQFTCIIKDKVPTKVKIRMAPFLYAAHNTQRVIITIKSLKKEFVLNSETGGGKRTIEVNLPTIKPNEKVTIQFDTPDSISPKQLGLNNDKRVIGVSIGSITFE